MSQTMHGFGDLAKPWQCGLIKKKGLEKSRQHGR